MSILNITGLKEGGSRRLERLLSSLDRERVRDVTDRVIEGTRVIGERQESIAGALEDATLALSQLRTVELGLDRARKAIDQEFETRRDERSENVALSALLDHVRQELASAGEREVDLQGRLDSAEADLERALAGKSDAEGLAASRQADIGRLATSFNSARNEAAELRMVLDQATKQLALLKEDSANLHSRLDEAEARRQEADAKAASLVQALAMAEAERGALERRAESQTTETARLGRSVAELEGRLSAEQTRTRTLDAAVQGAEAAAARLSQAMEEQDANTRVHLETADLRLETAQARSARLEAENADLSGRMQEAIARDRAIVRELADSRQWHERAEERVKTLEGELTAVRQELNAADGGRSGALERIERLSLTLDSRQADLQRLETQNEVLQQRIASLESELAAERSAAVERARDLGEVIERERTDHSIAQGALDAARKDRARLHLELLKVSRRRPGPDEVVVDFDSAYGDEELQAKAG